MEGIRVLDTTVVWAGPYGTLYLADLGAEVIRLESTQFFATSTRGWMPRPPKEALPNWGAHIGGYPDFDPGNRPWNRAAYFNAGARNKHSFTVDLNKTEGRELVYRLVTKCDVFVENSGTGLMDKLGLDYDTLRALNPKIVYASACGFGQTGPLKGFKGIGIQFEAMYGHFALIGYPDIDASGKPVSTASDGLGAQSFALAVIHALHARDQTGESQHIDLSLGENFLVHLGEIFIDYTMNGRSQETLGNRQPFAAPQGCYPCLGDDEWVAITISSDCEWRALCQVMDRPELGTDPRFVDGIARWKNHDELDDLISEWTKDKDNYELFRRLQVAGIAAGPLMHEDQVYSDPHLAQREFFMEMTQAETGPVVEGISTPGTHRYPGSAMKFSETPIVARRPPVRLGEDNEYVYKTLLGVSDVEYARLEAEGHIGMDYRPDIR